MEDGFEKKLSTPLSVFFSLSTITRTLKLPHKNSSEIEREREKN